MASKKCPKCGEDNPAEAVMCWACYTPLSGGPAVGAMSSATAALGAKGPVGKGAVGVPTVEEDSAKKGVDPKLIGVGAFLLVAGVIAFFVNMSMSTTPDPIGGDTPIAMGNPGRPPSGPTGGGGAPPPPLNPGGAGSGGGSAPPPPVALPFRTVTTPNPKSPVGTVGILISADNLGQAAGFARYAKDTLMKNGRWRDMQVCVFVDQTTANTFKQFQSPRRGAKLGRAEYAELASMGVWSKVPVFYETKGKTERIYEPAKSPNGWWG